MKRFVPVEGGHIHLMGRVISRVIRLAIWIHVFNIKMNKFVLLQILVLLCRFIDLFT